MRNPHHWPLRATHLPLNLSWIYLVPIPLMTRARSKIRVAETWTKTFLIDRSAGAVTKHTTSTWNALHRDAIHLVNFLKSLQKSDRCVSTFKLSPSAWTGHLTGKHERHFAVSGCPLYHNLSADECKVGLRQGTLVLGRNGVLDVLQKKRCY